MRRYGLHNLSRGIYIYTYIHIYIYITPLNPPQSPLNRLNPLNTLKPKRANPLNPPSPPKHPNLRIDSNFNHTVECKSCTSPLLRPAPSRFCGCTATTDGSQRNFVAEALATCKTSWTVLTGLSPPAEFCRRALAQGSTSGGMDIARTLYRALQATDPLNPNPPNPKP